MRKINKIVVHCTATQQTINIQFEFSEEEQQEILNNLNNN